MAMTQRPSGVGSAPEEPKIRDLLAAAKTDGQRLVKAQLELAQVELKASGQTAAKVGVLFIAALVLGFLGFVFLLVTAAYVLVILGLQVWAAFGIVTLVLLIIAAILALIGSRKAKKIKGPVLAKAEFERTKAVLAGGSDGAPSARS